MVRQSFSHGRSKQVVVEVKKRRTAGADGKPEAAAPAPRTGRQARGAGSAGRQDGDARRRACGHTRSGRRRAQAVRRGAAHPDR